MTALEEVRYERLSADVQRRQELLSVLNPSGTITYCGVAVAVRLALKHELTVASTDDPTRARARSAERVVFTTPICGDRELAVFAHETGHVLDTTSRVSELVKCPDGLVMRVSFAGELHAWRFAALALGRHWNKTMHAELERCLWTYRSDGFIEHDSQRVEMESLLGESSEQARQVVKMLGATR